MNITGGNIRDVTGPTSVSLAPIYLVACLVHPMESGKSEITRKDLFHAQAVIVVVDRTFLAALPAHHQDFEIGIFIEKISGIPFIAKNHALFDFGFTDVRALNQLT